MCDILKSDVLDAELAEGRMGLKLLASDVVLTFLMANDVDSTTSSFSKLVDAIGLVFIDGNKTRASPDELLLMVLPW